MVRSPPKPLTVFVPNQDLAIEHLVVAQDVHDHPFVDVLGRRLERNLHPAGLLFLQRHVSATRVGRRLGIRKK